MALVLFPGQVFPGRLDPARGAAKPAVQPPGRETRTVKVDLSTSAYVTGGFVLGASVTGGLQHVTDVYQLAGYDPYGVACTNSTCYVLYSATDPSRPTLKLYELGVEATDTSTRAGYMWLMFVGTT